MKNKAYPNVLEYNNKIIPYTYKTNKYRIVKSIKIKSLACMNFKLKYKDEFYISTLTIDNGRNNCQYEFKLYEKCLCNITATSCWINGNYWWAKNCISSSGGWLANTNVENINTAYILFEFDPYINITSFGFSSWYDTTRYANTSSIVDITYITDEVITETIVTPKPTPVYYNIKDE